MGHGYSHWKGEEEEEKEEQNGSSRPKLAGASGSRNRIRRAFRSTGSKNELRKVIKQEQFSGIVRITLFSAEMEYKDKWFACVSLGEQTFRTATSINTEKPEWNSKKNIILEANGPRMVRISVFETNRFSKNNLVGYCDLDLSKIFDEPDVGHSRELQKLYDPNYGVSKVVGEITLGYDAQDAEKTELSFARRLLSLVDYDDNGELSLDEFRTLIKAFGNKVSDKEVEEIYSKADKDQDGRVSADELAELIALNGDRAMLMKRCPVCGETLQNVDERNDIIHMTLCFDEGTGNGIMTGGFLTEKQASYGWMFKLSEWANLSSYDAGGLNTGASASHILVFDRQSKRLVEELIDRKIVLSLRAIYQSKLTLALLDNGTRNLLVNLSKRQGERMSKRQSAEEIPRFIEFFKDRIKVEEFKDSVESYKTFNDFFTRKLKEGCRPIAHEDIDAVAVCGADCRLMAYNSSDEATRLWIKGRKFSINGLLGSDEIAKDFVGGSLVIFRLAPQDYHRFHTPISGDVESIINIRGHLYTVNPIAVNSKYCNVFTENKRAVSVISSREFGKMAFVAIGATMVGSITFTKNVGDKLKKGDEFGYFSFGGSTCIMVFQKGAIELDVDLLANSERSLETLVTVGESLGVATKYSAEVNEQLSRPSIQDSVVGLNDEGAEKDLRANTSFNARGGEGIWDGSENLDTMDPSS